MDYRDLRDRNRSFDSLVLYNIMGGVGLILATETLCSLALHRVATTSMPGVQPYLGRFIHASEEHGAEQRARDRSELCTLAQPLALRPCCSGPHCADQ